MTSFCVGVSARNEADRIGTLIAALGRQTIEAPVQLASGVDNSSDDTVACALNAVHATGGRVLLSLEEISFAAAEAHAGAGRRTAMGLGCDRLDSEDAYPVSTDPDCRPPEDYVTSNLAAGAPERIVGGRIKLDQDDAYCVPAAPVSRRRYDPYRHHARAIDHHIDPSEWDIAPRHSDYTGASLTLSVGLYRRAAGVPSILSGEDRALVKAAVMAGGQLVHPHGVRTRTSARAVGRAEGGMAADMARWTEACADASTPLAPAFQPWRDRSHWRRASRSSGRGDIALAERALPPMPCDMPPPEWRPA